jgi:bifunctional UDP-N-acetylglucosamine pyrophosphorylase/glucosamine-1-phosphate N-acetyltransferase
MTKQKTNAKTNAPTAAIILAAGKGTRMKSQLPKVLHKVAGAPMVSHVVQRALDIGAAPITLVVAPGMDIVASVAREVGGEIDLAIQKEQLGTANAVLAAKESLFGFDGNIVILYGDTPLISAPTLKKVLAALERDSKCAVAVLGFMPEDPAEYGRLVVENGKLERIVEAKDANEDELDIVFCNSGVMALKGNVAWDLLGKVKNDNKKGEYYLTDVVELARGLGYHAVAVEGDPDEVLGVNSRNELATAEAIFQWRARKDAMDNGATLIDPDSVFFSADTKIGQDVVIEPSVFFGPGVRIANGAHIKAFSHIEGASIGEKAVVGPFARLRPGANLGEKVKVGNFVEIKKAEIAKGAKISHLSYVGDAQVGEEANIGAGTITCNYDGFNKAKTVIGKDAFIGSNTALVAPVTVGDGAIVAAGSVITQDVAPDALGLGRARQESKADWAKSFREKQDKK